MSLSFGMGAGGGRATFGHNQMRKFPLMQPLNKPRSDRASFSSFINKGTLNLDKDDKLESESVDQENDISGRHFLFDKTCTTLERTRTLIPPLPSDYYRSANLHPFSLSKGLSHSHAGRPFTLSYTKRYEVNPSSVLPSLLVLNGKNSFSVESCKLSRPKATYPTFYPMTVKDNQKTYLHAAPSYPDPVVGAPRSFIHRISELSSLQGETVRQEKLKKMRKSRKPPS
ncbi:uncharacterized protein si:ch211-171b20.3 [Kryptolebias marmoratus]|uniref:uncharacterized protein si:ch211-171b20.3 n=1 Tax=Kryptolebias marmoratus TaxID=37003 RepID=UPI0007F86531|nr:uncharacterized protein si:ch211-171b20.3 [Kryptolebias marmoratus]